MRETEWGTERKQREKRRDGGEKEERQSRDKVETEVYTHIERDRWRDKELETVERQSRKGIERRDFLIEER